MRGSALIPNFSHNSGRSSKKPPLNGFRPPMIRPDETEPAYITVRYRAGRYGYSMRASSAFNSARADALNRAGSRDILTEAMERWSK